MKIIALALLLAFAFALNLKGGEGLINFDFDPAEEEMFGIVMKGSIDPKNELNNKISTFLKLADYYVPILESINNEANNLKWIGNWQFNLGPLGTVGFIGSFNLIVGWNVALNQSSGALGTYLDVQYIPFAWGWADGNITVNNYLALGQYNSTLYYTRSYAIIDLQIYEGSEICFTGNAYYWPI